MRSIRVEGALQDARETDAADDCTAGSSSSPAVSLQVHSPRRSSQRRARRERAAAALAQARAERHALKHDPPLKTPVRISLTLLALMLLIGSVAFVRKEMNGGIAPFSPVQYEQQSYTTQMQVHQTLQLDAQSCSDTPAAAGEEDLDVALQSLQRMWAEAGSDAADSYNSDYSAHDLLMLGADSSDNSTDGNSTVPFVVVFPAAAGKSCGVPHTMPSSILTKDVLERGGFLVALLGTIIFLTALGHLQLHYWDPLARWLTQQCGWSTRQGGSLALNLANIAPQLALQVFALEYTTRDIGFGTVMGSCATNLFGITVILAKILPGTLPAATVAATSAHTLAVIAQGASVHKPGHRVGFHIHWFRAARDGFAFCISLLLLVSITIAGGTVGPLNAIPLMLGVILYAFLFVYSARLYQWLSKGLKHASVILNSVDPELNQNIKLIAFLEGNIFSAIINLLICASVVSVVWDEISGPPFLVNLNFMFSAVFILECVVKHFAYGFFGYWKEPLNAFDGVLVSLILFELMFSSGNIAGSVRVVRLFRFLRALRGMRAIRVTRGIQFKNGSLTFVRATSRKQTAKTAALAIIAAQRAGHLGHDGSADGGAAAAAEGGEIPTIMTDADGKPIVIASNDPTDASFNPAGGGDVRRFSAIISPSNKDGSGYEPSPLSSDDGLSKPKPSAAKFSFFADAVKPAIATRRRGSLDGSSIGPLAIQTPEIIPSGEAGPSPTSAAASAAGKRASASHRRGRSVGAPPPSGSIAEESSTDAGSISISQAPGIGLLPGGGPRGAAPRWHGPMLSPVAATPSEFTPDGNTLPSHPPMQLPSPSLSSIDASDGGGGFGSPSRAGGNGGGSVMMTPMRPSPLIVHTDSHSKSLMNPSLASPASSLHMHRALIATPVSMFLPVGGRDAIFSSSPRPPTSASSTGGEKEHLPGGVELMTPTVAKRADRPLAGVAGAEKVAALLSRARPSPLSSGGGSEFSGAEDSPLSSPASLRSPSGPAGKRPLRVAMPRFKRAEEAVREEEFVAQNEAQAAAAILLRNERWLQEQNAALSAQAHVGGGLAAHQPGHRLLLQNRLHHVDPHDAEPEAQSEPEPHAAAPADPVALADADAVVELASNEHADELAETAASAVACEQAHAPSPPSNAADAVLAYPMPESSPSPTSQLHVGGMHMPRPSVFHVARGADEPADMHAVPVDAATAGDAVPSVPVSRRFGAPVPIGGAQSSNYYMQTLGLKPSAPLPSAVPVEHALKLRAAPQEERRMSRATTFIPPASGHVPARRASHSRRNSNSHQQGGPSEDKKHARRVSTSIQLGGHSATGDATADGAGDVHRRGALALSRQRSLVPIDSSSDLNAHESSVSTFEAESSMLGRSKPAGAAAGAPGGGHRRRNSSQVAPGSSRRRSLQGAVVGGTLFTVRGDGSITSGGVALGPNLATLVPQQQQGSESNLTKRARRSETSGTHIGGSIVDRSRSSAGSSASGSESDLSEGLSESGWDDDEESEWGGTMESDYPDSEFDSDASSNDSDADPEPRLRNGKKRVRAWSVVPRSLFHLRSTFASICLFIMCLIVLVSLGLGIQEAINPPE